MVMKTMVLTPEQIAAMANADPNDGEGGCCWCDVVDAEHAGDTFDLSD